MSGSIVNLEGLGKSYRSYRSQWNRFAGWFGKKGGFADHWILRNVNLTVRAGESIGILGRNGAGKSTLLKMIAGTLEPSCGTLQVNGRVTAILELGMGFNLEFTARENVMHACGLMGYAREDILAAMPGIEEFAGIDEYFDQPMRAYSSGMQMRVAFAAATAFRPDLLIIDEAMSVGDLSFQAKCFKRIGELKETGTTLLYVSHAVTDVTKHCQRCIYIRDHTIYMDGPSRDVGNAYLDDLFGSSSDKAAKVDGASTAAAGEFDPDVEERFHTRPFYRAEEYRWGDSGARIIDYRLVSDGQEFPPLLQSGQTCRLSYRVLFEREVARPVFGLLIKSHDGVFLYGTNSHLSESDEAKGVYPAGSSVVANFEFPWHFNAGAYLISVGVSEERGEGDLLPLDRRYDAIMVTTDNPRRGSGIIDLGARFSSSGQGGA
ncbi:ABC transporter ATP-binding protein [Dyella sp. C9]|uniref:ABC transporter ATP-binding protein n=1 Tax=Dyella sp. C9 TaxID=2202154 RepID=UPI000DEFF9BF|nr:ABC transporter ATP-binding protein [Dyella sp. C9]